MSPGFSVGLGLCDCTGLVTSGFMNGARDFARRNVRAAFWLKRAGLAVLLASEVDHRVFLRQAVAWLGESAVVFPQLFAAGADIKVVFGIKDKVAARKGSVRPLGLIHELHVRLDSALVHQPPDHLGRRNPHRRPDAKA